MIFDSSNYLSEIQKFTMLDNVVVPILSFKLFKTQYEKFKTHTGTDFNYEQYYELLILNSMNYDNNLKCDSMFSSKYWLDVYEFEHIPNDNDEVSFNIDSSVCIIQSYPIHKFSIS